MAPSSNLRPRGPAAHSTSRGSPTATSAAHPAGRPTGVTKQRKSAPTRSEAETKEAKFVADIEARYRHVKQCLKTMNHAGIDFDCQLDLMMVAHATHYSNHPLSSFLFKDSREVRHRDAMVRRSVVMKTSRGKYRILQEASNLPPLGEVMPPRRDIRPLSSGVKRSTVRPTPGQVSKKDAPKQVAPEENEAAEDTGAAPRPQTAGVPHAAIDEELMDSLRAKPPSSGIILRLYRLNSDRPRIEVLHKKRKASEETLDDDAPVAKRTRAATTSRSDITAGSRPAQIRQHQSDETTTNPQNSSNKAAGGEVATSTGTDDSAPAKKRKRSAKDEENVAGSLPLAKRTRAATSKPAGTTTSTRARGKKAATSTEAESSTTGSEEAANSTPTNSATVQSAVPSAVANTTAPSAQPAAALPTTANATLTTAQSAVPTASTSTSTAAATTAAPHLRTRADAVTGKNGFQLTGPQHLFVTGHDQRAHLTQHYTILDSRGVRVHKTHTWTSSKAGVTADTLDWHDARTMGRLNAWLDQWLRRSCDAPRLRGDMADRRWTEEEFEWLRAYVAGRPEGVGRKVLVGDFNDHWRGRVLERVTPRGERVRMPPRRDRGVEAIYTAMARQRIGWAREERQEEGEEEQEEQEEDGEEDEEE
ncbi:uncharacterized protein BKCO1_5000054 [Diplodia corticola]|uniref:Uncharacterized protein n=1 Tax=Diplodia corticola TaxID=236234 RepID=A0A1J9RS86_9PEZI|nr:uncharacterized protein BKCO1_5000054 [Diplodia corticola]OJD31303.1 hypothetical protein BKCO1_5000054 [Diplodia corticola]